MTSQVSKDAFAASINLAAATGQTDSSISAANFSANISNTSGTGALDLTSSSNYGKVKFAISVDGGASVQVDLRDKLLSTSGLIQRQLLKHRWSQLWMQSWKDCLMQE